MNKPSYYIGVDGGGTKTTICVMNSKGRVIGQATAGPGNISTSAKQAWHSFEAAVRQCLTLQQIQNSDIHILFGSAGTESLESVEAFRSLKPGYVTSYDLVSDAYVACIGAHGGDLGAIIIVGTGVTGYQLEHDKETQVGGWGFPQSDEGGGAWLGLQAIRLAFKAYDGMVEQSLLTSTILAKFNHNPYSLLDNIVKAQPAEFGHFAPLVINYAQEGDTHALALLRKSGEHISLMARTLLSRQSNPDLRLPLTLTGGLSTFIAPYVTPDIFDRLTPCISDAVSGAVWLLRRKFSLGQ